MDAANNSFAQRFYCRALAVLSFLALDACLSEEVIIPEPIEHLPLPPSLTCTAFIKSGYTDKQSYYPGEKMKVSFETQGTRELCSLSIYTVTGDSVFSVSSQMPASPALPANAYEIGYGFPTAVEFAVPDVKSGIYLVDKKIPFIVKTHQPADLVVVYPSNTANAYETSGGKSLYSADHRPPAVSFQRPIPLQSLAEVCLKWFTSLEDFSVRYVADIDLDSYESVKDAKVLVIPGHSEYWTLKARRNFDSFVDSGGDALILSGNTMWWQVRYSEDQNQLICYKDANTDPVADPLLKTITWNEAILGYPIISSIGADFTNGGYGLKVDNGWNGYRITAPYSPLFEGLDLQQNYVLAVPTLEYDGAPIAGYDEFGYPILDEAALNFDKIELLGFDKGFRVNETVGTFIVFRKKSGSGIVVNTSSCNWCSSNGMGGSAGSVIKKITYNALDKLVNDAAIFSE